MRLVVPSGTKGDRLYLLEVDQHSVAPSVDEALRDTGDKIGSSFAGRTWPHGWSGEGTPHGVVFSR